MSTAYRVISADTHLQPAPEAWSPRVPEMYRDRAPRTIRLPNGTDAELIEGRALHVYLGGMCGKAYPERSPIGGTFDGTPGGGPPQQRLREQDLDGVDAEIIFAGASGISDWRGIRDNGAYRAIIHAYNEYLAEEYCAFSPDRLIGMGMIPDTGLDDALAEMEYCARAGLKGVCLNRFPTGKAVPTLEDDRFWAAALDMNMPLTVHVAFGGAEGRGSRVDWSYKHDPVEVASGVDAFSKYAKFGFRGGVTATQLVFSGAFDRFPKLRFYLAENQIGWIPNFLDQMDDQYERHSYWAERLLEMKRLERPPSEYVREHFWWGFMRNPYGVRARHEIGVGHVMWGSDFPHAETDWPYSQKVIDESFVGVPEDEKYAMLAGNAIEYFDLDAERPVTPQAAAVTASA